jgi:hypothetical protein
MMGAGLPCRAQMDTVHRFHRNSGVNQHSLRFLTDDQEALEKAITGDSSFPESERLWSEYCMDNSGRVLTRRQVAEVWTDSTDAHLLAHGFNQRGSPTIKKDVVEPIVRASHCLDVSGLLERCDEDPVLVHAVLQTFCTQGYLHITKMHQAHADGDIMTTLFHVVRCRCMHA